MNIGRTEVCEFKDKTLQEKKKKISICVTQCIYQNLQRQSFQEEAEDCKP